MKLGRKQLFLLYLIYKEGTGDIGTAKRVWEIGSGGKYLGNQNKTKMRAKTKLEKLEFLGFLIEEHDSDKHYVYRLTNKGKQAVEDFLKERGT